MSVLTQNVKSIILKVQGDTNQEINPQSHSINQATHSINQATHSINQATHSINHPTHSINQGNSVGNLQIPSISIVKVISQP